MLNLLRPHTLIHKQLLNFLMSKISLFRHTYLGRTGTEVELVTVCMLVVAAVVEAWESSLEF